MEKEAKEILIQIVEDLMQMGKDYTARLAIISPIETIEQQMEMLDYLKQNQKATNLQVINKTKEIIENK